MTAGQAAGRAIAAVPRARRAAIVGGAVLLALVGWLAWGWFRDSALVQVRHVQISGVSGHDARQIRHALEEAGLGMTTLHVRQDDLLRAASPYASVRSLSVSSDFPSTLHVTVDQRRPAAVLAAGKRRLAVAGDGTVLAGAPTDELPALPAGPVPSNGRLEGRQAALARVLGAAPAGALGLFDRIWQAPDGVRIALRDGPLIRFGSPDRLRAKWASAIRLLAARATVGTEVIDVRLPERPSAQFTAAAEANTDPGDATSLTTAGATSATTTGQTPETAATGAGTGTGPVAATSPSTTTEATNPQP